MRKLRDGGVITAMLAFAAVIDIANAGRETSLFHGAAAGQMTAVGRRLLAASITSASQCIWTLSGCTLNDDYVTSFSAQPSTESQKLLARVGALTKTCSGYENATACLANSSDLCNWSEGCYPSAAYVKPEWLPNRLFCSGSRLETVSACVVLTTESSCKGNGDCMWGTTTTSSIASSFVNLTSQWLGAEGASCYPKWLSDQKTIDDIKDKVLSQLNLTNTSSSSTMSIFSAVWKDLAGDCSSASAFPNLISTCSAGSSSRTVCEGNFGCEYSSNKDSCDLGDDFMEALLLDHADPWVVAMKNATTQCLALNITTCESSYNITINTTRYTDYNNLKLDFAPGSAGHNTPAVTVVLLSILFGFMLHLFLFAGEF